MPAGPVKSVHGSFAIPSLDGIRAAAVLIVFIGHGFTIGGLWPGHVGVTIFFFLSGYLITTLLRREYENAGRISLGKFYLRRALRILPPAYITIIIAIIVGAVGLLPATTTWSGVAAEFLNITNYYMIFNGREGLPPETSMLWSLAVEEHFYLVFPAVLIFLLRKRLSWRTVGWILVVACALAPVYRAALMLLGASNLHLYVGSDTRFDGLLAGAAMALLANPAMGEGLPRWIGDRTLRFVLAPIAAVVFALAAMAPTVIKLTVADTVQYICLFILFSLVVRFPEGFIGRVLNNRWVVHLGVLSFSVYLLHRLVLALVHGIVTIDPLVDVLALAITLLAAQLMYIAVERPLARLRKRLESRPRAPREAPEPVGQAARKV